MKGGREVSMVLVGSVLLVAACSPSNRSSTVTTPTTRTTVANTAAANTNTTSTTVPSRVAATGRACGNSGPVSERYRSVVVFAFENRTWNDVGGVGFGAMPYLHRLAQQCAYFSDWSETDTNQDSLTQYVGQLTGAFQSGTVNDCAPSALCSTQANNLFRQARQARLTAINYVEGATSACSSEGNAAKHVPALYMWGANDRTYCQAQVRPLSEFNPNRLPSFAFVTPTLCNDGHDCANATVDGWAQTHMQPVLDSVAYRAGQVAVFVWYDEYQPVPNMWITPTATPGAVATAGAGYAGTLRAGSRCSAYPASPTPAPHRTCALQHTRSKPRTKRSVTRPCLQDSATALVLAPATVHQPVRPR
ncbi:MAG: alkaline phosphatase family protein [Acidimicrobiia bacterium]